jgi:transposase-like protein
VVTETRRRWSEAEKQAVVAEAERPGVNISAVARRHGIKRKRASHPTLTVVHADFAV